MDILIKEMEMPKGCFECELCLNEYFDGNEWHLGCSFLKKEVYDDGSRDEDCPLVALPSHGRLIDADVLEDEAYIFKGVDGRIRTIVELCDIEDAPIVIEASGEMHEKDS